MDQNWSQKFIDDAVKMHNEFRKKHRVPAVKHSKDLSDYAQKWADYLAKTRSFEHSPCEFNLDRLGENIYYRSRDVDFIGQMATESWYSEIEKYAFGTEKRSCGTGNFTQVVWKGTKEVGFGKATSRNGKVYVVGSYRPFGNVIGHFKDNVPPPR